MNICMVNIHVELIYSRNSYMVIYSDGDIGTASIP